MVYFETQGDNDFASIFDSVADEARARAEREQAGLLLRLLDELESKQEEEERPRQRRVEHLRIGEMGDVIRDERDEEKRRKVMTVDQLPKESEYEMLFGKQEPVEPQLKVETGLRLRDGKPFQTLGLTDPNVALFSWTGIRFETVVLIVAGLMLVGLLLARISRAQQRRRFTEQAINREVERRVQLRMQQLFPPQPQQMVFA